MREINRYAIEDDGVRDTMGGGYWRKFTLAELWTFMAIWLYMGMKRESNIKSYSHEKGSIFYCSIIFRMKTRSLLKDLIRCLHITNPSIYIRGKDLSAYDKLEQARWLIEFIRNNCRNSWKS